MSNSWYKLKINNSNALVDPWPLVNDGKYGIWKIKKEEIFKKEWIDYMASIGLILSNYSMVFYRGPRWTTNYAHLDLDNTFESSIPLVHYGINWVLKGAGSSMVWYNTPKEKYKIKYTSANTPYVNFPVNTLTEIDRCNIELEPVLVRVGIPHSISVGDDERWCISARLKKVPEKMTWDEIVEFMRSKNLLVER
jgi:hypothetical protein